MLSILVRYNANRIKKVGLKLTQYYEFSTKLKMNTAYFRHVDNETQFHVSFTLVIDAIKLNKQFNFSRLITENCGSFLNRVKANVEKCVLKKKRKKGTTTPELLPTIDASLLCNGIPTNDDYLCIKMFKSSDNFTLKIFDQQLPIEINCPWIENIALPNSIMAGFLVYPTKFDTFFVDMQSCEWQWYHSPVNNGKWELRGEEEIYLTKNDDIGKFLRLVCIPRNLHGRSGPSSETVSPSAISAGPGVLPCETRHKFTEEKMHKDGFRIISYNILADLYVDSDYSRTVLFGYCPAYALELSYRRQLLLKELLGYNADIICLQEVDQKVFRYDLNGFMKLQGLSGVFSQKGESGEGTAIFYNNLKFEEIQNWRIILGKVIPENPIFLSIWSNIQKNKALADRVTDKSTTLQVLLLKSLLKNNKMLLVANIHLYFHPDADHIRLLQGVAITMYLESILKDLRKKYSEHEISLVWCGDFNSVPECGIYQLLVTHGSVPSNHPDWRSNEEEAIESISFETQLRMKSACGTPPFTNYTVGFKACLDYIFYEPKSLEVEQVVPLPDEEELSLNLGIPSVVFPSDHVALVSDLRWKQ